MPPASKPESGQRLARDMRRVRESRGFSVDDLHDETKIPEGLIEAFEDKALFDHPQFNRVYLRSFVRTYANIIGIDADVALAALEQAIANEYTGLLAVEYLGATPGEVGATPGEVDRVQRTESRTTEGASPTDIPYRDDEPNRTGEKGGGTPEEHVDRIAREEFKDRSGSTESTSSEFLAAGSEPAADYDEAAGNGDVEEADEWTVESPPPPGPAKDRAEFLAGAGSSLPSRKSTSPEKRRESNARRSDRRWIGAAVAVLVIAGVVWVVVNVTDGGETAGPETTGMADTVAGADTPTTGLETPPPAQPMPSVGDTIQVFVIAAADRLDPIRVTVDDDLRRPYWIELGDSMAFSPTNRIVVEEQLDDIELTVEGIEYPTTRRDDLGRIVITRDTVLTYFSTLEGP